MKRFLDVFIVIITMPIWLIVYAIVAFVVKVSSGSPVHFKHKRAGKNAKEFMFMKFRTMRDGEGSDAERTTRVGKFLRSTSLDELPQLWHVLSGKMSLVGPRPLPTKYLPRYSPFQARRHEVRPGITGWAQINGRNAISWEKKFELDVWYVEHLSFLTDVKVIIDTVKVVLTHDGVSLNALEDFDEYRKHSANANT